MANMQDMINKNQDEVLCSLAKENKKIVPAAVSNRHVHLSAEHIEILFGKNYIPNIVKALKQPGQSASSEVVSLKGKKGIIANIRVLVPARSETQVEISVTDSYALGIKPVVRMSGDLQNTPGGILIGPVGQVEIERGVIVSLRHLHMSGAQAQAYGLSNGDTVNLQKKGDRGIVLQNVVVRCGDGHDLEAHLDTDEANAAMIKNGDFLEIV